MKFFISLSFSLCILFSQSELSTRYHTYNEIVDTLFYWNDLFSDNNNPSPYYPGSGIIFQMEEIGRTGTDNLPFYAVKLSYNANQELDKPKVLILGQCHAEEILGVEISMEMIKRFLYPENHLNDIQTLMGILYYSEVWIVPSHNPEGLTVVHGWEENNEWLQDVSFRKNKTDANNNGVFDFDPEGYGNDIDGVDLNRNYDFNWFFGDPFNTLDGGCSANPSYISHYDYYRGEYPFSEKEVQVIRDFAIDKQFILSIAYHSSRSGCVAERVIYPWLWDGGKAAPDFPVISSLGQEIAELIDVEVGDGNYHHAASSSRKGNAHDWFYSQTGCIQYLIEVATENMQPADIQLIDDTIDRNLKGAYHLLKRAAGLNVQDGPDKHQITGIITDANTGLPIVAEVEILEMSSPILKPRLSNSLGRYRRLLYADTFTLKVSKFGYETQIIENIVPSSGSITELNVALQPLPLFSFSLNCDLPDNLYQNISMIRSVDQKKDTFQIVSGLNEFIWPENNYSLLFLSDDIFPSNINVELNNSLSQDVNLNWYDVLYADDFSNLNNWDVIRGDWFVENGTLFSQEDLVYSNFHPLGPIRINLLEPFSGNNQNISIKLNMKSELEWDKDTLFVDLFNEVDSLNIYSNKSQNWFLYDEYINTTINSDSNFLSIGIAPDITLGYRGLELNELLILSELNDCKKGDFNHDGVIDITDVVPIINYITQYIYLSGFQECASDANDDDYIDVLDLISFINYILENS
tara:strand:+ start:624 stop:2870 length:2247 start_codon:yes stop_codon:yes gene_type:complete